MPVRPDGEVALGVRDPGEHHDRHHKLLYCCGTGGSGRVGGGPGQGGSVATAGIVALWSRRLN